MLKNPRLARVVADSAFSELRRQLEYKATWYGSEILVADRFFPSTRRCSSCGALNDVPLSASVITCACGQTIDRDLNAALNLAAVAGSSSDAKNACGGNISPFVERQISEKQEPEPPGAALENGCSSTDPGRRTQRDAPPVRLRRPHGSMAIQEARL
jgi:putative transposase